MSLCSLSLSSHHDRSAAMTYLTHRNGKRLFKSYWHKLFSFVGAINWQSQVTNVTKTPELISANYVGSHTTEQGWKRRSSPSAHKRKCNANSFPQSNFHNSDQNSSTTDTSYSLGASGDRCCTVLFESSVTELYSTTQLLNHFKVLY